MEYTKEEYKILLRAYIDYKQLERELYLDFGETKDIQAVYNYIKELAEQTQFYHIDFVEVNLQEGYFDFNYNDMVLTISMYNRRNIVMLCDTIDVWNDKEDNLIGEFDFNTLEKIIFGYRKEG